MTEQTKNSKILQKLSASSTEPKTVYYFPEFQISATMQTEELVSKMSQFSIWQASINTPNVVGPFHGRKISLGIVLTACSFYLIGREEGIIDCAIIEMTNNGNSAMPEVVGIENLSANVTDLDEMVIFDPQEADWLTKVFGGLTYEEVTLVEGGSVTPTPLPEFGDVAKVVINDKTIIDLTEDTVTEADVAEGKLFHLPNGKSAVGTATGGGSSSGETVYVPGELIEFTLTQNGWNGTTYEIDVSGYTLESVQKAVLGYPINATQTNNELITKLGLTLMGGKYSSGTQNNYLKISALSAPETDITIGVFGLIATEEV